MKDHNLIERIVTGGGVNALVTTNDEHTNPNLAKKKYDVFLSQWKNLVATEVEWISDFRIRVVTEDGARIVVSWYRGIMVTERN